jgi:TDG/mug DNA glycosylase family protein
MTQGCGQTDPARRVALPWPPCGSARLDLPARQALRHALPPDGHGKATRATGRHETGSCAHPGKLFWRALFEAGLTPRQLAPAEFPLLPQFGIGLTDLAKRHSGNDDELPRDAFDAPGLIAKIERYAPQLLAFTSKNAARAALGHAVNYGSQDKRFGSTQLFVLPSPSGQARGHWDIGPWLALRELYRAIGKTPQDGHPEAALSRSACGGTC